MFTPLDQQATSNIKCFSSVPKPAEKQNDTLTHPGKLVAGKAGNPKMEVWKMICLFNWMVCRFHVDFSGV